MTYLAHPEALRNGFGGSFGQPEGLRMTYLTQRAECSPLSKERCGAVVVLKTPSLTMLEGRDDLAMLWDIRVSPEARGQGVGTALFLNPGQRSGVAAT
jgi:ribosomal protein S18 acetylase RimI-like enzyme